MSVDDSLGQLPSYEELEQLVENQGEQIRLLEQQVNIDSATGLMTKAAWKEALQGKIESATPDDKFGVIFIDFRRFSWVNNTFGHKAGDEILAEAAGSILATAAKLFQRQNDLLTSESQFEPTPTGVGRLGGDEIAIICDLSDRKSDSLNDTPQQRMEKQIRRLRLAFYDEVLMKKPELHDIGFNISIGGSVWEPEIDAKTLLERADKEMYKDKEAQRNRQPLVRRVAEKLGNRLLKFAVSG